MRLNSPLVASFIYKDEEYAIDLAFDNVLDVFDVAEDETLREYEKAEICLALLLDKEVLGLEAIALWNYVYENFIEFKGKQIIEVDLNGNPMPVQEDDDEEQNYSDLEQDAEYIYASFKQAYDIDLFEEQGKLHWHTFKALLHGLPSDTIMQRIIGIRAWKPSKGEPAEYKKEMEKLQKYYALEGVDDEWQTDE